MKLKKIIFLIVLLFVFSYIYTSTVYIVQSTKSKENDILINAFKNRAECDYIMFNLNNNTDIIPDIIGRIKVENPDIVFIIGDYAINEVLQFIDKTPVIITMFSKLSKKLLEKNNVCGIISNSETKNLFDYFKKIFPLINKMGLIFNTDSSLLYAQKLKKLANATDISIEFGNIKSTDEIEIAIKMLKAQEVKAIWLGQGREVNKKKYFDKIVQYTKKEHIPIISTSLNYINNGVCIAILPDLDNIGYNAANLAIRLNNGESASDIGFDSPDIYKIYYNKKLLKFFNIILPDKIKKITNSF